APGHPRGDRRRARSVRADPRARRKARRRGARREPNQMSAGYPDGPLFYRSLRRRYPRVVAGEGAWLVDDEGKRYLDASGGALVANCGHGVEEIARAVGG